MYRVPEATRGTSDDLSESEAFLAKPPAGRAKKGRTCRQTCPRVFHSLCIVANSLLAAALLYKVGNSELTSRAASDASHAVPAFSTEEIKFKSELDIWTLNYTSKEQSRIVRQRWQDLLPKGGGDVHIPDAEKYEHLSEPWVDARGHTLWKVSWAHQLHCLYLIMNDFDRVVRYGPTGFEHQVEAGHFEVHTNHCFDYLRQAILCSADMTLEGRVQGRDAGPGTDGWGHRHVCKNRREMLQWVEDRRVKDKAFIIDPDSPL